MQTIQAIPEVSAGIHFENLFPAASTDTPQFDNSGASRESWGIFDCGDSRYGRWQLQKFDGGDVFADDEQAFKHVYAQAVRGSGYHACALSFLFDNNKDEFNRVIATVYA